MILPGGMEYRVKRKNNEIFFKHFIGKCTSRKDFDATGIDNQIVFSNKTYPLLDLKIIEDYEQDERKMIKYINDEMKLSSNNIFTDLNKMNIYNSAMYIYFRSYLHHKKVKEEIDSCVDLFFKEGCFKNIKEDFIKYFNRDDFYQNFLRNNREKYILLSMDNLKENFKDYTIYLRKKSGFNILSDNIILFITNEGLTNLLDTKDNIYAIIMIYDKNNFIIMKNNLLDINRTKINMYLSEVNEYVKNYANDFGMKTNY